MPRYLHPAALDAVRNLAAKSVPPRRPRSTTRIRSYAATPAPALPALSVLGAALEGLRLLEVRAA